MYVTSPTIACNSTIQIATNNNQLKPKKALRAHTKTITSGANLFRDGDEANYVYQVLEGVVRSSKLLSDGRRQVLNFGYPSDIVGLSHDCSYHSDCDVVSDVKLRIFHKNACQNGIGEDKQLCTLLLRSAAAEVNNMQEHFIMLGRKSAIEKLASFLIAVRNRTVGNHKDTNAGFNLPMNRSDIADFLGLTVETVSRNLTRLQKMGVIVLSSPHKIRSYKIHELQKFAENRT